MTERVYLADAVRALMLSSNELEARERLRARAAKGWVMACAETFEEISLSNEDLMRAAAHRAALDQSDGDDLAAAIMMIAWTPPDDAEWTHSTEHDVKIGAGFWNALSLEDPVWLSNSYLGRLPNLVGFEQNLIRIYFGRSDLEAMGGAVRDKPLPSLAPMRPSESIEPTPRGGYGRHDAPFVVELMRRFDAGEARSDSAAAAALFREKTAAGVQMLGASENAIVTRWRVEAKRRRNLEE